MSPLGWELVPCLGACRNRFFKSCSFLVRLCFCSFSPCFGSQVFTECLQQIRQTAAPAPRAPLHRAQVRRAPLLLQAHQGGQQRLEHKQRRRGVRGRRRREEPGRLHQRGPGGLSDSTSVRKRKERDSKFNQTYLQRTFNRMMTTTFSVDSEWVYSPRMRNGREGCLG